MFKVILAFFLVVTCAYAANGVDIATFMGPYNVSQWQCLHNNGVDFAIIEIWRGKHQLSDHYPLEWQNAKAAGIYQVDAYAYICNNCPNNTAEFICSAIQENLPYGFDGMLWLDVEDCPSKDCWIGTPQEKLAFIEGIADNCEQRGFNLGVYSGHGAWEQVFGAANFTSGKLGKYPFWFSHYDNKQSMDDYKNLKVADWERPTMKQYNAGVEMCGIKDLDVNYY